MPSLYEELLSNISKTASTAPSVKKEVNDLSTDELIILANELAGLTGDTDLAEMAKILPVYASGSKDQTTEGQITTEQTIKNSDPVVEPHEDIKDDSNEEVVAEENTPEKEVTGDKKSEEDNKEKDDKEKDDKKDDAKKCDDPENCENTKSATETLYQILKEGAAFEELIEIRASQMVDALLKEAEEAEIARQITDETANQLTPNPMKAYEYSQQMMEKAKTVSAESTVPLSEAAAAVAKDVLTTVGKTPEVAAPVAKEASTVDRLGYLAKSAADIESAYEKIAQEVGEIAETVIMQAGLKQGLEGADLHEFIQKNMEGVKTLAAKKNINLAQAAQEFLAGEKGSISGVNEPIVPSPSQVPSPAKAPINSNQTQQPDQYFEQMVAPADPSLQSDSAQKQAAVEEYVKSILKEAIYKNLAQ